MRHKMEFWDKESTIFQGLVGTDSFLLFSLICALGVGYETDNSSKILLRDKEIQYDRFSLLFICGWKVYIEMMKQKTIFLPVYSL